MAKYWIQCPVCGYCEIKERAAQPFLSPEMKERVEREIEEGARAVILDFNKECPRCSSTGESTGKVRVLRPLKTQNS